LIINQKFIIINQSKMSLDENLLKQSYNIGEMFGKEGMDLLQHNLDSDQYRNEINNNMEAIVNKFRKINKTMNDTIKKDALLELLDSNVIKKLKIVINKKI